MIKPHTTSLVLVFEKHYLRHIIMFDALCALTDLTSDSDMTAITFRFVDAMVLQRLLAKLFQLRVNLWITGHRNLLMILTRYSQVTHLMCMVA